jgi:hypothetical protein
MCVVKKEKDKNTNQASLSLYNTTTYNHIIDLILMFGFFVLKCLVIHFLFLFIYLFIYLFNVFLYFLCVLQKEDINQKTNFSFKPREPIYH